MSKLGRKKWLIIILVIVIVVILAIPTGVVLAVNNYKYDCSYQYTKIDNPAYEIAKKHMYYSAADKTVEIDLSQDMINSLIKDNMSALKLDLPKNVSILEMLFNTKDQRLYMNTRYGSLNVPVSVKLNVKTSDSGLELTASDPKIGNSNAPGFVKKQLSLESMKFAVNFADLGVPQVFSVKNIQYGSGDIKATIQLDPVKVADLAVKYRPDLMKEIDTIKAGQPAVVSTFLTKLLGTGVLSEDKIKAYVQQALGNEELVNSARYFATSSDLTKYTNSLNSVQKTITDWAAPVMSIQYNGNIDELKTAVLDNTKLEEFLSWFLPQDQIVGIKQQASDYYAMYQDYYGMYEQLLASIDSAVGGIKNKDIDEYAGYLTDGAGQFEEARKYVRDKLALVTDKDIQEFVYSFEGDKALADEMIANVRDAKAQTQDFVQYTYTREVDEFNKAVKDEQSYIKNVVGLLKAQDLEGAANKLSTSGVQGPKAKAFIDKYSKEWDLSFIDDLKNMQ